MSLSKPSQPIRSYIISVLPSVLPKLYVATTKRSFGVARKYERHK
jgi:hypothetical protein